MNDDMNFYCNPWQHMTPGDAYFIVDDHKVFHERETLHMGLDTFLTMVCATAGITPAELVQCLHSLLINSVYFFKAAGLDQWREKPLYEDEDEEDELPLEKKEN